MLDRELNIHIHIFDRRREEAVSGRSVLWGERLGAAGRTLYSGTLLSATEELVITLTPRQASLSLQVTIVLLDYCEFNIGL